jgi:hypothetical protein
MIPMTRQWTVGWVLISATRLRFVGGVEMEEKGERYRDGDKVSGLDIYCTKTAGPAVL